MMQSFSSLPDGWSNRILCYYENATNQIQLTRIVNIPNWLYERVVFPGQRLLFEAIPDALLEVHICTTSMTLLEEIPCPQLQVRDGITAAQTETAVDNDSTDLAE